MDASIEIRVMFTQSFILKYDTTQTPAEQLIIQIPTAQPCK